MNEISPADENALKKFTSDKLDVLNGMSVDPRITATDFRVAFRLIQHVNAETLACFPSQELLADEAVMKERTVRNSIARLKDAGWIKIRARSANGRGKSNFYAFLTQHVNAMLDRILLLREAREENRKQRLDDADHRHVDAGETLTTGMRLPPPTGMRMPPNTLTEHLQTYQVKREKHLPEESLNAYAVAKEGKVA
ncbi:helix-turn-helix protein [Phyllobacterium myrsinacearum]|uniref:helix-turn-helix domain-containing protein n=1 Tax=Phyllobacterium myrsinacearum TaxID=28101 RepID=UPI00102A6C80|nr:helix-turn-helix domain-containing protein [Phyllobacterium myrsinacearum]RZS82064.1 helix-turn-helix protein [Phyllobacterium myrsinacearum]